MTVEEDDYNNWTVTDLKAEANNRGLAVPSSANKADIVQLLEENDEEDVEEEEDEYEEEEEEEERERLHAFGTCVPLAECPHFADEVDEEEDEAAV